MWQHRFVQIRGASFLYANQHLIRHLAKANKKQSKMVAEDYAVTMREKAADDESLSLASSFSNENTDGDAFTIDYDEFGMDSSRGEKKRSAQEEEDKDKPLIGWHKLSSIFRWKMFVVILMCINTAIVVAATSLYLNHEADQEFQRAVSEAWFIQLCLTGS